MNSFKIKIEHGGHCWLCGVISSKMDCSEEDYMAWGSCFKMLLRYLQIDIWKASNPSSSGVFEGVIFCEKCDLIMKEFLEWYQNLEAVRLCLANIIVNIGQILGKREDTKSQIIEGENTDILDSLRKTIITKSEHKLVSKPRVALNKVKTENLQLTHFIGEHTVQNVGGDPSRNKTGDGRHCKFCHKVFSQTCHANRHSILHHTFLHFSNQFPPNTTKSQLDNAIAYIMEKEMDKQDSRNCTSCKTLFFRLSEFQYHVIKTHWNEIIQSLTSGSTLTATSINSKWLSRRKKGCRKELSCKFCPKTFTNYWNVRRHSEHDHTFLYFSKKLPPATSQLQLENAIMTIIEKLKEKKKSPKCVPCNKVFSCQAPLRIHAIKCHWNEIIIRLQEIKKDNHGQVPISKMPPQSNLHVCRICQKSFKTRRHLTLHKRSHQNIPVKKSKRDNAVGNHKCKFCPKHFSRRDATTRHSTSNHTYLHFSKQFPPSTTSSQLEEAVATISDRLGVNKKRSKCFKCKKHIWRSVRNHTVSNHWDDVIKILNGGNSKTNVHATIMKDLSIPDDNSDPEPTLEKKISFNWENPREVVKVEQVHLNLTNRSMPSTPETKTSMAPRKTDDNESSFQCHKCGDIFTTKDNLDLHYFSLHGKARPYGCSKCERKFKRKRHLSRHLQTVHKISISTT